MKAAVQWTPFDPSFLRWFKRKVNPQGFTYSVVNGNCAWAAHQFHRWFGPGQERYGFYLGPVSNPYWADQHMPLVRHAWLECEGLIYDPTRWCFLRSDHPMLAVSPVDSPDYDAGMNKIRLGMEQPMPEFKETDAVDCDHTGILSLMAGKVSNERLFWLANLAPSSKVFLSRQDWKSMFQWLIDNKHGAWIPIDNRP